jgi:hypothetical protein
MPDIIPKENQLKSISTLGLEQYNIGQEIKRLQESIEAKQKRFDQISKIELPAAMSEVGMRSFVLVNDATIKIIPILVVNYLKENIELIETWLNANGHPGMVKNNLIIEIPKGNDPSQVMKLKEMCFAFNLPNEERKAINWQTLNKWGRDMEGSGQEIPEDLFTVYRATQTIIER